MSHKTPPEWLDYRWDLSPQAAVQLQQKLATRVRRVWRPKPVQWVGGVDVGVRGNTARAAVVILSYPDLSLVDYATAEQAVDFPYVPGLLSFREGPVILAALAKLDRLPDLLIFDGHGIAHPRRLGIASHIGVLVDMPAIGCAKSILCGQHADLPPGRGSTAPLLDRGETIGAAVRTRTGVRPVYVSIGHRIDLPTSVTFVLNACKGYRLPETTRWAHRIAGGALPPKGFQQVLWPNPATE